MPGGFVGASHLNMGAGTPAGSQIAVGGPDATNSSYAAFPAPPGVQDGDQLLLMIANDQADLGATVDLSGIVGWVPLVNAIPASDAFLAVLTRTAHSEPATYNLPNRLPHTSSGGGVLPSLVPHYVMAAWRGETADVAGAVGQGTLLSSGAPQPATAPSVVARGSGIAVGFWWWRQAALGAPTPPSGFTNRVWAGEPGTLGDNLLMIADMAVVGGATGDQTALGGGEPDRRAAVLVTTKARGGGLTFWM